MNKNFLTFNLKHLKNGLVIYQIIIIFGLKYHIQFIKEKLIILQLESHNLKNKKV